MGQIDRYVNSVYRHIGGNKEEMKNHLLQLVEELKSKGKSEDESISIAIKQFGEKKTN
ncbi:permease prefix domain 1-containing protein [Clostridium haemolyticum]|uniref:permease prefix domain 1-containing protein n=1 Tax=Clostridium haemolyticum TaxID=84025 RepID=UPI001FA915EF|nr:permease prefix domain 1-containing protein [Clostridium haemolyticum]